MADIHEDTLALLKLSLTPGLGPVLIGRLVEAFGSAARVLGAEGGALRAIKGIGPERAAGVIKGLREVGPLVEAEIKEIEARGVRLVARTDAAYPALLAERADAPPLLYVRGTLETEGEGARDRFTLAVVGSRACTQYGVEQAERFATVLGSAGITIVSGGARGIDTAAHRAAARAGGRTVAVLGCGLSNVYPPDNAELFEQIVSGGRGAIVSELPMTTPPSAENFPARNRIIAGLSLGVLVIEAARGSGALITAAEMVEMGREVFALPGRVDSPASEGSLGLLKQLSAALVTEPADVLAQLETPARHAHAGVHGVRYGKPEASLFGDGQKSAGRVTAAVSTLSTSQAALVGALESPRTMDELAQMLGVEAGALRADVTVLEIRRIVKREGSRIARA